jgi:hypothetical protein
MASGPLLGNGDVGVMQSGAADCLLFYIGKNDFWSRKRQSPIAVGHLRLVCPELQGAQFETVQDMSLAEIRGDYVKGRAHLKSRTWVDANRNILFTEINNRGGSPLSFTLKTVKGAPGGNLPKSIPANASPVKVGCEQYGRGRWFFNGEMAGFQILDRALGDKEIAELVKSPRPAAEVFDGKSGKVLVAPQLSKAITISCWIKAATLSSDADYLVSRGEWNQCFSLGLSQGRLRFTIDGVMVQSDERLPLNQWIHLAATFDGTAMRLIVDGKLKAQLGGEPLDSGSEFLYAPDAPDPEGRRLALASRVLGAEGRTFTLPPGRQATICTAILSDLDVPGKEPQAAARDLCSSMTLETLLSSIAAHRTWWQAFWDRSFIEIPDKTIEQSWYASWYTMACCSRPGKVAPGLWGNWITVDNPAWHGDYHLNYNFQAPFYGLYSANHLDLTLPYYIAINQSIPRGRKIAAARGWKGIHLPVSIGPWGMCPEGDNSDFGQRSNAAYAALPYIWHWQHSRDVDWLKREGYAYLTGVADFWEDYLKLENGRYVIRNDAIHENDSPTDVNPIVSIGLLRALFGILPEMSEVLNTDHERRTKWRDIRSRLSDFPTQKRDGKLVFRYTETGTAWRNDNTLGIQHIFPAGAIGLDSDKSLIDTSLNMIDAMGRWSDYNGSSSWYTACVRVGYDPRKTLAEMHRLYAQHSLPNKLLNFGGGGIENVSPSLAVTEMLMQSHEGVIRLFPCWPRELDARFGKLRAVGAFLVSAELKKGVVSGVAISSEAGGECTILNPWPGHKVKISRKSRPMESAAGERLILKTARGERLELAPEN